jgi:hypothetical protein
LLPDRERLDAFLVPSPRARVGARRSRNADPSRREFLR